MKKILAISVIILNVAISQVSLLGLEGWYNANMLATAGGIGTIPSSYSDIVNPAGIANKTKQIQLDLVKYPASINAKSIIFVRPLKSTNIGFALRHMGYGNFNENDENGNKIGTYSAGDTWLNTSIAQSKKNFDWGISGGIFISNLDSYNSTALVFSSGITHDFAKFNIQTGISLSNFGFVLSHYTDYNESLPTKLIVSMNKGLAHLPLDINADIRYYLDDQQYLWRVGGVFSIPNGLKLTIGINSNNIDQRTEYNSLKSTLGSSGVGLSYSYKQYSIGISGYSYGAGGWIYGSSLNIKL